LGLVSVPFLASAENCMNNDSLVKLLECFQRGLDSQQKQIAKLEEENQVLQQKTDAFSVSSEGNIGVSVTNPKAKLHIQGDENGNSLLLTRNTAGPYMRFKDGAKVAEIQFSAQGNYYNNPLLFIQNGGAGFLGRVSINANVGIGTTTPSEKLQVNGNVKATAFKTGDIFFEKNGETLWQMFQDENGLYVKQIKTGKTFRLMLE